MMPYYKGKYKESEFPNAEKYYSKCNEENQCAQVERIANSLGKKGFKYFILHLNLIPEHAHLDHREFFSSMFSDIVYDQDNIIVYSIDL